MVLLDNLVNLVLMAFLVQEVLLVLQVKEAVQESKDHEELQALQVKF